MEKDIGGKINGFEIVSIKIKGETENRYIIEVYRKPGKKEIKSTWEKLLENKKKDKIWTVGGDFNAHSTV